PDRHLLRSLAWSTGISPYSAVAGIPRLCLSRRAVGMAGLPDCLHQVPTLYLRGLAMSTPPICGAQQPTPIPGPFDWTVFTAIATAAGFIGGAYALAQAIPGILSALGVGATTFTAAAAGAGAIVALVVYYALKPDGCIRSTPKGEPICLSGI